MILIKILICLFKGHKEDVYADDKYCRCCNRCKKIFDSSGWN